MTLLRYEQSCSADPDTKTCAAPYDQCRDAMVEILGTNLRTNCACSGTAGDFRELFECIEYQRLFWVNPCVGKLVSLLLCDQHRVLDKNMYTTVLAVQQRLQLTDG